MDKITQFFDQVAPAILATNAQLSKRAWGTFQFDVAGVGIWTVSLLGNGAIQKGPAQVPAYTLTISADDMAAFIDNPSQAWTLFLSGRVALNNACATGTLIRRAFPGSMERGLGALFAAFFSSPNVKVAPATIAAPVAPALGPLGSQFLSTVVPQRFAALPPEARKGAGVTVLDIADTGVWTIDAASEPLVKTGAPPHADCVIQLGRDNLEALLAAPPSLWSMFLAGQVTVSNTCRAARFADVVFPGTLQAAMPPGVYKPFFEPPNLSPSALEGGSGSTQKGKTYVMGPKGPVAVTYSVVGDLAYYQGDIVLGPVSAMEQIRQTIDGLNGAAPDDHHARRLQGFRITNMTNKDMFLWPNKTIPYTIDSGCPNPSKIPTAMQKWTDACGIVFRAKEPGDVNYVTFMKGSPTGSYYGRQGEQQFVYLSSDSVSVGTIAHEIGHLIGLLHEHQRQDRDDYITVNLEAIDENYWDQFEVFSALSSEEVGLYDYSSIMHYSPHQNAKKPSSNDEKDRSILVADPIKGDYQGDTANMGQRDDPSAGDVATVKYMYE